VTTVGVGLGESVTVGTDAVTVGVGIEDGVVDAEEVEGGATDPLGVAQAESVTSPAMAAAASTTRERREGRRTTASMRCITRSL
jgi:hypothetical protein